MASRKRSNETAAVADSAGGQTNSEDDGEDNEPLAYQWDVVSKNEKLTKRLAELWGSHPLSWPIRDVLADDLTPTVSGAHPFQPDTEGGAVSVATAKGTLESIRDSALVKLKGNKSLIAATNAWHKEAAAQAVHTFNEIAGIIKKEQDIVMAFMSSATAPATAVVEQATVQEEPQPTPAATPTKPRTRVVHNPLLGDVSTSQEQKRARVSPEGEASSSGAKRPNRPRVPNPLEGSASGSTAHQSDAAPQAHDQTVVAEEDVGGEPSYTVSAILPGSKIYTFTSATSASGTPFDECLLDNY